MRRTAVDFTDKSVAVFIVPVSSRSSTRGESRSGVGSRALAASASGWKRGSFSRKSPGAISDATFLERNASIVCNYGHLSDRRLGARRNEHSKAARSDPHFWSLYRRGNSSRGEETFSNSRIATNFDHHRHLTRRRGSDLSWYRDGAAEPGQFDAGLR